MRTLTKDEKLRICGGTQYKLELNSNWTWGGIGKYGLFNFFAGDGSAVEEIYCQGSHIATIRNNASASCMPYESMTVACSYYGQSCWGDIDYK